MALPLALPLEFADLSLLGGEGEGEGEGTGEMVIGGRVFGKGVGSDVIDVPGPVCSQLLVHAQ